MNNKNGDRLRRNLADQLSRSVADEVWTRAPRRRSASLPVQSPQKSGREDPTHDNPLSLASGIEMPDSLLIDGSPSSERGSGRGLFGADESSGFIHRRPSYGSFASAGDEPLPDAEPGSPQSQDYQTEIVEEYSMNEFNNSIDTANLNIIGEALPPPGYRRKEGPLADRIVRQIHRLWVAPALAGVPAFIDEWWKSRRARQYEAALRARAKKGAEATLQGILARRLGLTPGQALSARVAGGALLFLMAAFLIYCLLESRRRDHRVIVDASQYNLDRDRVITLIPKEMYLLGGARAAAEDDERLALPANRPTPPAPRPYPYEYPPANRPYRLKGGS